MRTWGTYSYTIATHFLPALINGDTSGLTDDEVKDLLDFEAAARERVRADGFTVGHWADAEDSTNFTQCEVCGLYAETTQVYLMVYTD